MTSNNSQYSTPIRRSTKSTKIYFPKARKVGRPLRQADDCHYPSQSLLLPRSIKHVLSSRRVVFRPRHLRQHSRDSLPPIPPRISSLSTEIFCCNSCCRDSSSAPATVPLFPPIPSSKYHTLDFDDDDDLYGNNNAMDQRDDDDEMCKASENDNSEIGSSPTSMTRSVDSCSTLTESNDDASRESPSSQQSSCGVGKVTPQLMSLSLQDRNTSTKSQHVTPTNNSHHDDHYHGIHMSDDEDSDNDDNEEVALSPPPLMRLLAFCDDEDEDGDIIDGNNNNSNSSMRNVLLLDEEDSIDSIDGSKGSLLFKPSTQTNPIYRNASSPSPSFSKPDLKSHFRGPIVLGPRNLFMPEL